MGKNSTQSSSGAAGKGNNAFLFDGDFVTGTWPTLLDQAEAQRVKRFIENLVFRSSFQIKTGNPQRNSLRINFNQSETEFLLQLQTALRFDLEPYLGGDLNLDGYNLVVNKSGSIFRANGDEGFCVGSGAGGTAGSIKLLAGGEATSGGTGQGFKANSGAADIMWILPAGDGDADQVLTTDGSAGLERADNAGGGGGMTSFDFSDPDTNSFSVTNGNDVAFTSDDGSVSIDCSTADVIDLAASGIPNIDGGTPDSVYVINQNADGGSPSSTF